MGSGQRVIVHVMKYLIEYVRIDQYTCRKNKIHNTQMAEVFSPFNIFYTIKARTVMAVNFNGTKKTA